MSALILNGQNAAIRVKFADTDYLPRLERRFPEAVILADLPEDFPRRFSAYLIMGRLRDVETEWDAFHGTICEALEALDEETEWLKTNVP